MMKLPRLFLSFILYSLIFVQAFVNRQTHGSIDLWWFGEDCHEITENNCEQIKKWKKNMADQFLSVFFLYYLIKQFSINANPLKLEILSAIISRRGFQTKEKNRPLTGIN